MIFPAAAGQTWQSPAISDGASCGPGRFARPGTGTGLRRGLTSPARPESRGAGTPEIYAVASAPSRQSQRRLHRVPDGQHVCRGQPEHLIGSRATWPADLDPIEPGQRDSRDHIGFHPHRTTGWRIGTGRERVMPRLNGRRRHAADWHHRHQLAAPPSRGNDYHGPNLDHLWWPETRRIVADHNVTRAWVKGQRHPGRPYIEPAYSRYERKSPTQSSESRSIGRLSSGPPGHVTVSAAGARVHVVTAERPEEFKVVHSIIRWSVPGYKRFHGRIANVSIALCRRGVRCDCGNS